MSKIYRTNSSYRRWMQHAKTAKPGKRIGQAFDLASRKMALEYVQVFRKGMDKNNLGLKPVSAVTKIIKSKTGAKRIASPLMNRKKLVDSVQVRKIRGGYRAAPYGRHYSGFKAADLFRMHAETRTVVVKNGRALSLGGGFFFKSVTIPGRNPFPKVKQRFLRRREKMRRELMQKVKMEVMPK